MISLCFIFRAVWLTLNFLGLLDPMSVDLRYIVYFVVGKVSKLTEREEEKRNEMICGSSWPTMTTGREGLQEKERWLLDPMSVDLRAIHHLLRGRNGERSECHG